MKLHLWPTFVLNTFLICIWQCNGKKKGLRELLILKNFLKHDMPVKYSRNKKKIVPLLFNYFSSNKIEFMDLDNMERIDWKKPKWDRVTTQRQKRNLAKLLSNQTSRVLLVYLVFFVFTLVTLVEKSSQSVNRSDVAKSKSFQFSPILL